MTRKTYDELAIDLLKQEEFLPTWCWYLHYKWTKYRVESLATLVDDDRNLQTMVVYRPEWYEKSVFTRNVDVFLEEVESDGRVVRRFSPIKD